MNGNIIENTNLKSSPTGSGLTVYRGIINGQFLQRECNIYYTATDTSITSSSVEGYVGDAAGSVYPYVFKEGINGDFVKQYNLQNALVLGTIHYSSFVSSPETNHAFPYASFVGEVEDKSDSSSNSYRIQFGFITGSEKLIVEYMKKKVSEDGETTTYTNTYANCYFIPVDGFTYIGEVPIEEWTD